MQVLASPQKHNNVDETVQCSLSVVPDLVVVVVIVVVIVAVVVVVVVVVGGQRMAAAHPSARGPQSCSGSP